ncbi:FecR domain-containing protein [uncultured Bacteroides sp.]|uniref:FecR family protein n=1 Tax=uncultured Bacteroides sp. TaxID=162156 RepID=UPI002AA7CF31|nr:FecR domain-containing protein [uncultured Bacteroides sp.]
MNKKDYTQFKAVDFAKELKFISWQLMNDKESAEYWKNFIREHPKTKPEIERAIEILHSMRFNANDLSSIEQKDEIEQLKNRIVKRKKQRVVNHFLYPAIAACILFAIIFINYLFFSPSSTKTMHDTATGKEIQLIAGNSVMNLPANAVIEYFHNGKINIKAAGNKTISVTARTGMNTLIVPKGKRSTLCLADGTRIKINSGSVINFPSDFAIDKREISASGEVYLEVAKNKFKPFSVNCSGFQVQVLGTKFNISTYNEDKIHSVVLVEGSVKINSGKNKSLRLQPNQMATISSDQISSEKVNANDYVSWKDGILSFSSKPLGDVLTYLARYYDVDIKSTPDVKSLKCNGKLVLMDDINSVLNSIGSTMPIKFYKEGNKIQVCLTQKP